MRHARPLPPPVPDVLVSEVTKPALEKVTCNCPPYRGTDFWNDPHRWCSRDPETERVWEDKPERSCERTYRPVKQEEPVYEPVGSVFDYMLTDEEWAKKYYPQLTQQLAQQQASMQNYLGGLHNQNNRQQYLGDLLSIFGRPF